MTWSAAVAAALGALATIPSVTPAAAQFYKGKTLTLIVNYGVGGNIDTEARILARHLPKHIAGAPTIIIQNTPGAGGLHAMNLLGLNIKSRADGLTAGFFTISPTAPLIDDPALQDQDVRGLPADRRRDRMDRRLCAQGYAARTAAAGRHRQGRRRSFSAVTAAARRTTPGSGSRSR